MGGRGAGSGKASPAQQMARAIRMSTKAAQQAAQPQQAAQQNTQPATPAQASNWVPPGVFNYTLAQLPTLNDSQVLQILNTADGIDMPNHLADSPDATQELVYALGFNAPPTVLDSTQFGQFMKQNNIPRSQIMSRGVGGGSFNTTSRNQRKLTQAQIAQMWISDPYTYVGGKIGGQALGAGAYFDMNGGKATGYGGGNAVVYTGVLNPKTARVISAGGLQAKAMTWARTHPQSDRKIKQMARKSRGWGSSVLSLYALMLGYNTISGGGGYHNVITRDAMVIKQ